jgi:hypothetical protein
MSLSLFPLPIGGLRDDSGGLGDDNFFKFLAGLAPRNPAPTPPPTSAGDIPVRALRRSTAGQPQASIFETGTSAAPSDGATFSGGLLGRLAALAGLDQQNPGQPAPPPDDQLRGFYRDDPVQPWFVQRQR